MSGAQKHKLLLPFGSFAFLERHTCNNYCGNLPQQSCNKFIWTLCTRLLGYFFVYNQRYGQAKAKSNQHLDHKRSPYLLPPFHYYRNRLSKESTRRNLIYSNVTMGHAATSCFSTRQPWHLDTAAQANNEVVQNEAPIGLWAALGIGLPSDKDLCCPAVATCAIHKLQQLIYQEIMRNT